MTASEVCTVIERETGQAVTPETPLDALNLDSLELVELFLVLGNAAGREIPDSKWGDLATVANIASELA